MTQPSAIVIGAGIAGLATARALAIKGYAVTVIERNARAVGASVRNFGMVWPVGQPSGTLYQRAMRSRVIWEEICTEANIWHEAAGSLHLAHHADEWQVLQELYEHYRSERSLQLLSATEIKEKYAAVVPNGLQGGLYSSSELIVDPREAIAALPAYLSEKWGVRFVWDTCATAINGNMVETGDKQFAAAIIYVCGGADFKTLYPELFAAQPITQCKLQMLRMAPQPGDARIGTALCGGLSLAHYASFKAAASLPTLQQRYNETLHEYMRWGIHVMVSQNGRGELTVGDSHEYGPVHDPFDKAFINQLILDYLRSFARFADETIIETWHGIYPKLTNGGTELVLSPAPGVYIINGLGGAGMTLSFGLAEEVVDGRFA
jgi:FAD dependent oxidoreductase TIGR03364